MDSHNNSENNFDQIRMQGDPTRCQLPPLSTSKKLQPAENGGQELLLPDQEGGGTKERGQ